LLTVDIRALSASLKRQQPALKDVRVVRQLPNTLRIEPVYRAPAAQVRLNMWYPVDASGFILPHGFAAPSEGLLQVTGMSGRSLKPGTSSSDERLQLALRVQAALRRAAPGIWRRTTEINVADPQQIRFVLEDTTEVRCGTEAELEAHLDRLQATLKELARQSFEPAYIDVRFPDPVVAPRT
jgi:cell division septal protein FtsQ